MSTSTFGPSSLFEEDLPSAQATRPGRRRHVQRMPARGLLASGGFWIGGAASLAFWISLAVAIAALTT